ncbi:tRNA preQ1(34) S-adenosylmethionine ribosyltransferase-isomerase QueA [Pirellulaceae bacterium SH449]
MAETPASHNDLDAYDFQLPRELIAQDPPTHRTDSRMMLVDRRTGRIEHYSVRDLPSLLRAGDVMVVNDSKVIAARLVGYRETTRGRWEGLFLRHENGIAEFLSSTRGKLVEGERIVIRDPEGRETQRIVYAGRTADGNFLFRAVGDQDWFEFLDECGRIPLPPYIRDGQMTAVDRERYQTVYARNPGSVAAPTAGLHLTQELIGKLRQGGTALVAVTLHVGLGTFRPIQSNDLSSHKMHSERANISEPVVKRLLNARSEGGRIIAVGTTSVRTLESAAMMGGGNLVAWGGETDIFIKPGHRFQAVDGLLTNFHLPKSSLIVLVSALAGSELIREAYAKAIEERYRFYSYGDCMLIL